MKGIRARLEQMGIGSGDVRFLAGSIAVCLIVLLAYGLTHVSEAGERRAALA